MPDGQRERGAGRHDERDVLAGWTADRGRATDVEPPTLGERRRAALAAARRHPRATAAVAALAVAVGAAVAVDSVDRSAAGPPAISLGEACSRLVAYRDAYSGREWSSARADLVGVVHGLPADGTGSERAVRTYADATLGPPTAGPARYLVAADRACRQVGRPLLPRW